MFSRSLVAGLLVLTSMPSLWVADGTVTGRLTDPQGKPVRGANLRLTSVDGSGPAESASDSDGRFIFSSLGEGTYQITATEAAFAEVKKTFHIGNGEALTLDLQFARVAPRSDTVTVTAASRIWTSRIPTLHSEFSFATRSSTRIPAALVRRFQFLACP